MSDLLERLRDMAAGKSDDLDIAAEAIEEIIDLNWRVVLIEEERDKLTAENRLQQERFRLYHNTVEAANSIINELSAKIAAHEKVCAGEWVKVTKRLPDISSKYTVKVNESFRDGQSGTYVREMSFNRRWRHQQVNSTNPVVTVTHWWDARMPGGEER